MELLKLPLERLIFEAYRRNRMALNDDHEQARPITERWLGLGTAAAYRPAIEAGLMRFHDGRTPPRGCQGWLCLTEQGVTVMVDHIPKFEPWLQSMLKSDYGQSYHAHYMLMGGLAAN